MPGVLRAGGTAALVTPQNWLFLGTYKKLRARFLENVSWNVVARLGPRAFDTISGEVVNVALLALTRKPPSSEQTFAGLDASEGKSAADKAAALREKSVTLVTQKGQLGNPDARLTLKQIEQSDLLSDYAEAYWGQGTGDFLRFGRTFWETPSVGCDWSLMQSTVAETCEFSGREQIVFWEQGNGTLVRLAEQLRQIEGHSGIRPTRGAEAWGKAGVCVSLMRELPVTRYGGQIFDGNCAAVIPKDERHLPAIRAFCFSPVFRSAVRAIDQKMNVTNQTLLKVPFDLAHWQKVAAEKYPNGLPKPYSSDPTQWLFNGHPSGSDEPLQVAVARLLGYRWPRQSGSSFPDCPALCPDGLESFVAKEGMVCLPAARGERPAAEGLLEVLQAAYGSEWSDALLHELLTDAGSKPGASLDDWLRSSFFDQHCKQFHQRPFIWHIWDGRKDGFSCLVNYHLLDHVRLESLAYAYVGDWIRIQYADAKAGKVGADLRLAAAQGLQEKLKLILAGEPPYDIFVRWKPLSEQAIGWKPDLNDGVRMNIRPFVQADILRKRPNIKWTKDRGKEPERDKDEYPWFWNGKKYVSHRVNDIHLANAEKLAARR